MSELSLYRKYRPQTFSHLVGQEHVRITLLNAVQEKRAVHGYLFCGPRGTGKTSTARLLAKALNCLNPGEDGNPCDACDICVEITEGKLIDIVEIDAASNSGVDDIRELRDKIHFAPTRAKNKIYIIDEVHMLSKSAFNALLKTLEEPPEQVYFILATTESHKIPGTIISRCQRFDFKRIDPKTMMTRLSYIAQMENIQADDKAIETIARNVDGGLRDAIGLFEQLTTNGKLEYKRVQEILGLIGHEKVEKFFGLLKEKDMAGALAFVQELYREGADFLQFNKEFIEFLREEMLTRVSQKKMEDVSFFFHAIEVFQQAASHMKTAVIPQLPVEIGIIRFLAPQTAIVEPTEIQKPRAASVPKQTEKPVPKTTAPSAPPSELKSIPQESKAANGAVDLSRLSELWPRVTEHLKTPSLKQSLKEVKGMHATESNVIELEFMSKFYMEKVLESTRRVELEAALEKVFGGGVKVIGSVKKVELAPKLEKAVIEPPADDSLAEDAAAMFGGEIIDE